MPLLLFALGAGLAVQLLRWGIMGSFYDNYNDSAGELRFFANVVFAIVPILGAYFIWVNSWKVPPKVLAVIVGTIVVAALAVNLFPFQFHNPDAMLGFSVPMTFGLAALHLPVLLWLLFGVIYTRGDWRNQHSQMSFMRFTGEWVIHLVLFALGGMALLGLTAGILSVVDIVPITFYLNWLLPFAIPGAIFVAAWLVNRKTNVAENIAPVLARVFTPLTVSTLLTTLFVILSGGPLVAANRYLLILLDIILILVLALVLYSTSARDPLAEPNWFDWLLLATLAIAFTVNLFALAAMVTRIAEYGASANKAAALGLNILLFVHLILTGLNLFKFLRRHTTFQTVEKAQANFLPIYAAWAAVVILIFPPIFRFA